MANPNLNIGDLVVCGGCLGRITEHNGKMYKVGEYWAYPYQIRKADHRDETRILKKKQ